MLVTLAGSPVLNATIRMGLEGVWTAEAQIDRAEVLSGLVSLTDGENAYVGTVIKAGVYAGRQSVSMVGGAGGLRKPVESRTYKTPSAGLVLSELLELVGETLSPDVVKAVKDSQLRFWHRAEGTAGVELARLCSKIGFRWRVRRDGSVWIGADTYPAVNPPHELLYTDPARGWSVIGPRSLALEPGVTFRGAQTSYVAHTVGDKLRTEYGFFDAEAA